MNKKNSKGLFVEKDILFIFILALGIRLIFAHLYRTYIGLPYKLLNFETEGFGDFEHFYLVWAENFISMKWYPYSYGNVIEQLNWYSYTPFFLYTISLFKLLFLPKWSPAIPIVLFDSGCAIMIFKILNGLSSKKSALLGSIVFSVSAVNIFYIGTYWLNPSPMIFFLLVSFYYLINCRHYTSIFYLVISIMMKQTGLYYVPLFIAFLIRRVNEKRKIIKLLLFFIVIGVLFQIPYIFLTPNDYFSHLFATPNPVLSTEIQEPIDNYPITLPQFLHYGIKINDVISGIVNKFISTYFLFTFFIILVSTYTISSTSKNKVYNYDMLFLFTINGIVSYILQPKGIYKYYVSTLIPFLIMSVFYGVSYMKKAHLRKYYVTASYIIFNIFIIFIPRIYTHGLMIIALIFTIYLYQFSKTGFIARGSEHGVS